MTIDPTPKIGYRQWRLRRGGVPTLASMTYAHTWEPRQVEHMDCAKRVCLELANVPRRACECGFYAHYPRAMVPVYGPEILRHLISGSIVVHGHIQIATQGFRAQHAQVVALEVAPERGPEWVAQAEAVAERYHVPLLPRDLIEEYTLTYGESPHG